MKKDIFDKIMELPLFRIFNPIYKRYKSTLLYLFFGFLTTVLNIFVFHLFFDSLNVNELISNIIAWFVALVFAFITNRIWVFDAHNTSIKEEFIKFTSGRLITLGIEEIFIFIFISKLGFNALLMKIVCNVIVIVLNYIISKFFVFK